jgi:hypothetical protein
MGQPRQPFNWLMALTPHHTRPGRLGSIVEVARIKGPTFNSKEESERHGL